jgi:hypothetical protein
MTLLRALLALTIAGCCQCVSAADTARTKDIHNVKAVDVLSAARQREIGDATAALGKFAPTVLYGQGHIYLLQQCLREQPGVQLVAPLSYLAGT